MLPGVAIAAGHYVEIDTAARSANWDGYVANGALGSLDWFNTIWPAIPPSPDGAVMTLAGDASSGVMTGVTQVQASWQDEFLT
jgi:hypothetical protein